jgi:protease-4
VVLIEENIMPNQRSIPIGMWIAVIIISVFLLGSILLNFGLIIFLSDGWGTFASTKKHLKEKLIEGRGTYKIACIPIKGIIIEDGVSVLNIGGADILSFTVSQIKQAAEDSKVKAVLLEVDSPGGSITASDIIYHQILEFKKTGKKIIVFMKGTATSGAYYVSAPADYIMAQPTTITGSIGVLIEGINIEKLLSRWGIEGITIKSAPKKDILSPTKKVEELEDDKRILKKIIMEMHARFVEIIAEGRKRVINKEEVQALADGTIYTATEAKKLGLIDEIGYKEDALKIIKKLTGIQELKLIRYERSVDIRNALRYFRGGNLQFPISVDLSKTLLKKNYPKVMLLPSGME